ARSHTPTPGRSSCRLSPGECPDGGPSHTSPVAADPLKFQLRDAAVRQEIPVLAKRLGLACQDGLLHVLGGFAWKGRVPGPDPLQVMAVGATDLRQVEPAFVQTVDFGRAGPSGHRRVEGLDRVEIDLWRAVAHDAVEGAEADAAGEHRERMHSDRQSALL